MIKKIRLASQQLLNPSFTTPKELVTWMGAMQAQNYNMAKWAVGLRLQSGTLKGVDEALEKGDILRTHVMRPTWHFVAAEDIRWMLQLSAERIRSTNGSYGRDHVIEHQYVKCNSLFEKILEGGKSLLKEELGIELSRMGVEADNSMLTRFLMRAETDGVVCSGIDKGTKHTYALLEERVAPAKELCCDEALVRLATMYFRSHSPASLADFVWWSGLSVTDARKAVNGISEDLVKEDDGNFIHNSCVYGGVQDDVLHLLPSYDEYLISYKDRSAVLADEYRHKAFNNWGIFYPIVMLNGTVVGNWKKGRNEINTSFFKDDIAIDKELLRSAGERYRSFML